MPIYEYKALNASGKAVSGMIDADSPRALRDQLKRNGQFLTRYTETKRGGGKRTVGGDQSGSREISFGEIFGSVKVIEVAEITRQLSTLIKAGVPMVETLAALAEQVENPKLKRAMSQVKRAVSEGASLANALREHPKIFSNLYVNMVAAGESSGNLDVVFARLAEFTEAQVRLRAKVMGAMMYPIIMVVLGFLIVTLMMVFVIPQIAEIFTEMGTELPWMTTLLINTSNIFVDFWWLIFAGIIGGSIGFKKWKASPTGKKRWDRFVLKIPIFGSLIRQLAIARFTRTLSTLLNSGVPILTSMTIVKSVVTNETLSSVIEEAREAVKEGHSIAEPLKASGEFPSMVTHMIAVGERSGELEGMLGNVADSYEVQVESKIGALASTLEPIMILIMGASVAFLVFAILMPMMQMNEMFASGGG
jgi:general secretion pathway protein F